jgi:ferredoxin
MKRKIIEINQDLCNGCELCVTACHEGAIKMIEREADAYNEELVMAKIKEREMANKAHEHKHKHDGDSPCGCSGMMAKKIERTPSQPFNMVDLTKKPAESTEATAQTGPLQSQLGQWPVQMKLINPTASYLEGADILVAADCTAYAYGNFHNDFIKGKVTIIGCPKLDDNNYNKEKLIEILKNNDIKSLTVVRMEVPCCTGIVSAAKEAMLESGIIVQYNEVTISTDGRVL